MAGNLLRVDLGGGRGVSESICIIGGTSLLSIVCNSFGSRLGVDGRAKPNGVLNKVINASLGEVDATMLAGVCVAVGVVRQLGAAVEILDYDSCKERLSQQLF
jgi:hypothetical protein